MKDYQKKEGIPFPFGVSDQGKCYNFALYSKHATNVELLLYKELNDKDVMLCKKIKLDSIINKSQRVWHCTVLKKEIQNLQAKFYAYRIDGPKASGIHDNSHAFDPEKTLLDPFSRSVFFPKNFSRAAACQFGKNDGKSPLGVICTDSDNFDWENSQKPEIEPSELVIYELHVRQFTNNPNSKVGNGKNGTFAGLIKKIPYLKDLGVTAVELLPVQQYDPQEYSSQIGFHWGYMTLNFFAPHKGYSYDKNIIGSIREFKTMVKELHKVGIAVIMDVVYNHTTEGDYRGPHYSYKGIDNSTYYLTTDVEYENEFSPFSYSDFSGTGNTLHCANAHVRNMILESLRYWAKEMKVDGFRFDIGSIFLRDSKGNLNYNTPIFSEISNDPWLREAILIAEPWGPEYFPIIFGFSYVFGKNFPGLSWRQWNDKYRVEMKKFVKGDDSLIGKVMQRLYGSDDAFPDTLFHANHGFQSINYVASHDGLTMYDCTAYTRNEDQSWDCNGNEELRKKQVKNFITLLMLSNGIPMFRAGDEFCQTQNGLNNPYNTDDDNVWLNWDRLVSYSEIHDYFKKVISFRKKHPTIGRSRFWREDISWFGTNGTYDLNPSTRTLAFHLKGHNEKQDIHDDEIYVMINMYWDIVKFYFQEPGPWNRIINTGLSRDNYIDKGKELINNDHYSLFGRSIAVFIK